MIILLKMYKILFVFALLFISTLGLATRQQCYSVGGYDEGVGKIKACASCKTGYQITSAKCIPSLKYSSLAESRKFGQHCCWANYPEDHSITLDLQCCRP